MDKISEKMILNYLRKNPEAGDTLEGITRWWLEIVEIKHSMNEVTDSLNGLIKKGLIRTHKTKEGTTFYRIKKESDR